MQKIDDSKLKHVLMAECDYASLFGSNIAKHAQLMKFSPQEYIVKNQVKPDYLFYLVRGKAKLYDFLANGKDTLVDFFTPPCFVGEMELMDTKSEPFSVQVIDDCYCLALPVAKYKQQLLADPVFLRNVCLYLAHKNARNIKTASQNQGFTLSQRLSAFILLTSHDGRYHEKHTQVAEYLGVSYRHLLYVIAEFVKAGYLQKDQRGYRIKNEAGLQNLAWEVNLSNEWHEKASDA
ncbi:transcriptional regulator [Secundilactobacillus pentosiphilus]|uniref:Transcriptional regulator n=1 Tax=Secundilactobacillus pentosiphilus TaxID=1714682 RepID=A0A1Z5ILH3_9LACO|nr:transcriptional regulator YeiL [Secundilactobacillus pentosiphilus]GAX02593.1 transcriptional regulator [Secundilactobacillus pentosiphilus]